MAETYKISTKSIVCSWRPELSSSPINLLIILMNDTEVIALQAPIEYTMNDNAELQNGRWAMIGIMAALGAYATTGQIIPGIF